MQLTVNQGDFQKAIAAVLGVVDKRGTMPILSHVLLEANGDGGIHVKATDLEVSYKGFCQATIAESGSITIPAHQLATLVKDMPAGTLQVETTENFTLKMTQGEAKYRLHGLDPDQFPPLPGLEEGVGFVEIPSCVLKEMIKKVIFSISLDDLSYHLSSVLFENIEGRALRLVSTDGHRLTVAEHSLPLMGLVIKEDGILVPRKGVAELLRFAENSETVSLALQKEVLIAVAGDKTLTIRLMDRKFPEYRRIIPEFFTAKWTFNREAMFRTLKRLSLVNTERFKGVVFTPNDAQVLLDAENAEIGDGHEIVPWTEEQLTPLSPAPKGAKEGEEGEEEAQTLKPETDLDLSAFGFNIKYLLDPLAVITAETMELLGNSKDRPFLVKAVGDDSFFSLIMPMSN